MKPILLLVFLFLQSLSYSQIAFEEITSPDDFSLFSLRQSPTGEYFAQADNDKSSIHTSMNGQDWTRTFLPEYHPMSEIQFYADGTPLLKNDYDWHLIRRDDSWYTMKVPGTSGGKVEASFIKDDTLFVFQEDVFAYSLDKGLSFSEIFTATGIEAHTAELWKYENLFIMHNTIGASDYLSVYTKEGARIFNQFLGTGVRHVIYNNCGQLLLGDYDSYYLFKAEGLELTSLLVTNIFPDFSNDGELFSRDGIYYARDKNTIYRATGCNFSWEVVYTNDLIDSLGEVWITDKGDVFLYDFRSDYFVEQRSGSSVWENHQLNIDYAYIFSVDESAQGHQMALTSNALFSKKLVDLDWTESDTTGGYNFQAQYSPDGDLYVNRKTDLLYSANNGISFSTIQYPPGQFQTVSYSMEVLDDDVLIIFDELFGEIYYSLNNGQDWIVSGASWFSEIPPVRLVGNYLIITDLSNLRYSVTRINLITGEYMSELLGDLFWNFNGSTILEDGTIYFHGLDINSNNPEGLYRYRFEDGLEFLGPFEELAFNIFTFASSGSDFYAFTDGGYYLYNGETLEGHAFNDLPMAGVTDFSISENQHVYAVVDNNRIFRSVDPLSFPQFISGYVYKDPAQDCTADTSDTALNNWQVRIESDQYLRIKATDSTGHFNFAVPKGNFTLSSQPINSDWDLCASTYNVTIDENVASVRQDFLAKGLRNCAGLELDFSTTLLRRCFDNYYSVRVRNTGPESSDGTILTIELDPFFEFTSATIPFTLVGDSIVIFDLGVLEVNDEIYFRIFFKLSCDADLGVEHCLTGILTDDNICGGDRSSYIECQENIGSYDPNDKRVFNSAGDEAERIDKGEYIYYHIRFQNTGTDTAFNIRVVDPLSPKLDLSTLEMLSASQSYEYFISDGPELVVLFDDVLLPDSTTNEPASHGFFKFRIKPLPEFDYGTSIPNQADIYFDFNEPVITNEAIMFILPPVGTKDIKDLIEFSVFPNPASDALQVTISTTDGSRIDEYEIMDYQGRRITQSSFSPGNVIPVAQLAPGIYNLMLKEKENIVGMEKFVRF